MKIADLSYRKPLDRFVGVSLDAIPQLAPDTQADPLQMNVHRSNCGDSSAARRAFLPQPACACARDADDVVTIDRDPRCLAELTPTGPRTIPTPLGSPKAKSPTRR
jgi:hypothetical protein